MHRALALLVMAAFVASAGQASRLHTHAYTGHEHPEHRHGLAAHDHDRPIAHEAEKAGEGPHAEPCDPGRHEVSLTIGSAPATSRVALDIEVADMPAPDSLALIGISRAVADARAHGPPSDTPGPSRAPPHILPA